MKLTVKDYKIANKLYEEFNKDSIISFFGEDFKMTSFETSICYPSHVLMDFNLIHIPKVKEKSYEQTQLEHVKKLAEQSIEHHKRMVENYQEQIDKLEAERYV